MTLAVERDVKQQSILLMTKYTFAACIHSIKENGELLLKKLQQCDADGKMYLAIQSKLFVGDNKVKFNLEKKNAENKLRISRFVKITLIGRKNN